MNIITHPSAYIASEIENVILSGKNSNFQSVELGYLIIARMISATVFPIFLSLELAFKQIPKLLLSAVFHRSLKKTYKNLNKIQKYCFAILLSPLGIVFADAVSFFFLKRPDTKDIISPFCVTDLYGKKTTIYYPETKEDLQTLVKQAIEQKKEVTVIGAGMSQGSQTVPSKKDCIVINTKNLNKLKFINNNQSVEVQSGATWEQVQIAANKIGKSVIVKQSFDIFSVGGSISINCHGWAHKEGSISSTIESLEIINAKGELELLTPKDELFSCLIGSLGYFGLIVSATIKLTENEHLIEKSEEIKMQNYIDHYNDYIKGKANIPLFAGRISLDTKESFRSVCMVHYETDQEANQDSSLVITEGYAPEPKYGTRLERIALHAFSCLPIFFSNLLISLLWRREKANMLKNKKYTRNEVLHFPVNTLKKLRYSKLHAYWLQEYFIRKKTFSDFLRTLGETLKNNQVKLINATLRSVPEDKNSILPYAGKDRHAAVICFYQEKTKKAIARTENWIKKINNLVTANKDLYYQAYMPFATKEEFEKCYIHIKKMRALKKKYDPTHVFGNAHTAKYFDSQNSPETKQTLRFSCQG